MASVTSDPIGFGYGSGKPFGVELRYVRICSFNWPLTYYYLSVLLLTIQGCYYGRAVAI